MKNYSDYAFEKLKDLYQNHSHEVGSVLKRVEPEKYKDYVATDCITYSLRVLSFAFEKTGDQNASKAVWKYGSKGVDLAKYLVNDKNWKAIYINPDSRIPSDGLNEHPYTSHVASKTCRYYQIPLSYAVRNYSPTPVDNPYAAGKALTKLNSIDISSLEKVKFGFGISKGGMHTWVFSLGKVYEVHWDKVGPGLYEATDLRDFPWLSGAIIIPPAQAINLSQTSALKCG